MRIFRFPDRFCADSRPYWVLFVCFILSNILVIYTLYTRQPERYRRISHWFSVESPFTHSFSEAQSAAFTIPGSGQGTTYPPVRTVEFGDMTLGPATAKQVRKRDPGAARYGVEVVSIDKKSVPYLSGMRSGDVIVSVNRMPTYTVADFERVARNMDTSQGILFDVYRNGRFYYMTVETRNPASW